MALPQICNAVVTGKIGTGQTLTAKSLTGNNKVEFDFVNGILKLAAGSGTREYLDTDIDISAATTVTLVLSGTTWTLTVS